MVAVNTVLGLLLALVTLGLALLLVTIFGDVLLEMLGIHKETGTEIAATRGSLALECVTGSAGGAAVVKYDKIKLTNLGVDYKGGDKKAFIVIFWQRAVATDGNIFEIKEKGTSNVYSGDFYITPFLEPITSPPRKGGLVIGFFEENSKCVNLAKPTGPVGQYQQYQNARESDFASQCSKFLIGTINVAAQCGQTTNLNQVTP